jgi:hypothetical protein
LRLRYDATNCLRHTAVEPGGVTGPGLAATAQGKESVKTTKCLALVLLVLAVAMPAAAQSSRLYDRDVKALLEQTKSTYDRFWDALDNQLKGTTFKGASGEFVVKKINDDYKAAIDLAKSRFTDTYSAGNEVGAVLKDAVRFQNYVSQQSASMKGASEWQAHANVLGKLAAEYGATFPPAADQAFRRYGDKEVIGATQAIEASSKQLASALENALKKDKATPEATRKSMVAEVNKVGESAKMLGSAVKDAKPATAHVTTLFDQVKKVQGVIGASSAASTMSSQLGSFNAPLATIGAAFHQK